MAFPKILTIRRRTLKDQIEAFAKLKELLPDSPPTPLAFERDGVAPSGAARIGAEELDQKIYRTAVEAA